MPEFEGAAVLVLLLMVVAGPGIAGVQAWDYRCYRQERPGTHLVGLGLFWTLCGLSALLFGVDVEPSHLGGIKPIDQAQFVLDAVELYTVACLTYGMVGWIAAGILLRLGHRVPSSLRPEMSGWAGFFVALERAYGSGKARNDIGLLVRSSENIEYWGRLAHAPTWTDPTGHIVISQPMWRVDGSGDWTPAELDQILIPVASVVSAGWCATPAESDTVEQPLVG